MTVQQAVKNEIDRLPVIMGSNAIAPYLEFRRKDTDEVVPDVFSINLETGLAKFPKRVEAGMFEIDEDRRIVMVDRILDLRLYYFTIKVPEPEKKRP